MSERRVTLEVVDRAIQKEAQQGMVMLQALGLLEQQGKGITSPEVLACMTVTQLHTLSLRVMQLARVILQGPEEAGS